MSALSKIEWTERTWNPVRGCSVISPGCVNCYAMKQAHRFSGPGKPYEGLTKQTKAGPQWTGTIRLVEDALTEPLSWRKPCRVFVNSMSDLFHEDVPDEFIDRVFAVMALSPRHTFQVLTKRAERMRDYLLTLTGSVDRMDDLEAEALGLADAEESEALDILAANVGETWPLPNVWLGVSAEDQQRADERIPKLLQTPAAVRFVSAEPLLGPVDLGLSSATCKCCTHFASRWIRLHRPVYPDFPLALLPEHRSRWHDAGITRAASNSHGALSVYTPAGLLGVRPSEFEALPALDWIIAGGESGPKARPCDLAWVRSIVEQCKAAGVACFVKQLGAKPESIVERLSFRGSSTPKPDGFYRYLNDRKGGNPEEWPADLRVRQFPEAVRA